MVIMRPKRLKIIINTPIEELGDYEACGMPGSLGVLKSDMEMYGRKITGDCFKNYLEENAERIEDLFRERGMCPDAILVNTNGAICYEGDKYNLPFIPLRKKGQNPLNEVTVEG